MAKATALVLLVCALLCLARTGDASPDLGPCQDTDLQISTAPTGRTVGGKPEYRVTVANQCSCPVAGVVLYCPDGVPSATAVDIAMIRVVDSKGMLCLLHSGWPISKSSPVTFTYAWDNTLGFTMYNASPRC